MALGDSYNYNNNTDNNKKQYKDPEVYSGFNTSNENGIDPSALSYSFWSGTLKIAIAPMLKNPTDKRKWDHQNAATIFLLPRTARVFLNEIKRVLTGEINNGGVESGGNLITFSNGKELGANGNCLIIRDINSEGIINATYVYEFRHEYHHGIYDFKPDDSGFEVKYYDDIEEQELMDILEDFSRAMSNAYAYTTINAMRFDTSRTMTKLDMIGEALGVEFKGKNGDSNGNKKSSYFNNNSSSTSKRSSSRQTTLDEIGGGAMNPPEDDD